MSRVISRLWRNTAEAAAELPAGSSRPSRTRTACGSCARRTGAIDKVTADIGARFSFNTAIAAVMELLNELSAAKRGDAEPSVVRFALSTANSLLFPFAPHATTDGYALLNDGARLWEQPWPEAEERYCLRPTRSSSSAR